MKGVPEGTVASLSMAYEIGSALGKAVQERALGDSRSYRLYAGPSVLLGLKAKANHPTDCELTPSPVSVHVRSSAKTH